MTLKVSASAPSESKYLNIVLIRLTVKYRMLSNRTFFSYAPCSSVSMNKVENLKEKRNRYAKHI